MSEDGKILADMEKELFEYSGDDRVVHFTEFLLSKAGKKKAIGFKSGFQNLDKKLGLIEPGRVIVVSGFAKQGKTTFVESWIKSILEVTPEAKATIFSFEMDAEQMLEKYAYNPDQAIYVPFQLESMNFEWLVKRCLEAKLKYNARIVFIDHLHYMIDMNMKQNMSLNIGAFMRRLKLDIAMKMNMVVILVAHQEKEREGEEASMRGARDSSFIGQECDAFIVASRRKNFGEADFKEISAKRGNDTAESLRYKLNIQSAQAEYEDEYSQGLAVVKVECSRMSGAFKIKILYRKEGNFLVEV